MTHVTYWLTAKNRDQLWNHMIGNRVWFTFTFFSRCVCCSLCTTLCLQWEPEIIAVAVMYLTSRLTKFDIIDWQGKPSGYRGKWYDFIVEDVTLELLEGGFD